MTRVVRPLRLFGAAALLLTGLSAPLAAQPQADPVRLDDFAVAAEKSDTLQIDQVATKAAQVDGSSRPAVRTVTAEQPVAPPTAALSQLSTKGQKPQQVQLSKTGAAPDETAAAVSSTAQSRPQGVVHIAGRDRCDPQLAKAELERCQRILELRAQEFNAPAPPTLSAEQELLAEQRSDEDGTAGRSAATRLRLASRDDPDANLASNQELAALYLNKPEPPAPQQQPAAQEPPEGDASLAQVINAIQAASALGGGTR